MSALTTYLGLYKPGGGSSGLIVPDEVIDVDRLNGNSDLIDLWAKGWGDSSKQTRDFTGPAAQRSTIDPTPREGDYYLETDGSKITWKYVNGSWVNQGKQAWTPTFTGLTLGAGSVVASYQIVNGWVFGMIRVQLGAGFTVSPDPKFDPPVPISTNPNWNLTSVPVGQATLTRTGTGFYIGAILCDTASKLVLKSAGGASFYGQVTSTTPATWAANDTFDISFAYPI